LLPTHTEPETLKIIAIEDKNRTEDELLAILKQFIIYTKQVYYTDSSDLKLFRLKISEN